MCLEGASKARWKERAAQAKQRRAEAMSQISENAQFGGGYSTADGNIALGPQVFQVPQVQKAQFRGANVAD